jgi:NADH-quinone oxidoreductase subunit A
MTPTMIAGYLALFFGLGFVFLFANLLVGKFLRPANPNPQKLEVYECGEPAIGSAFVQFDLRFYVVALLFLIFDVEVAFFFPWAAVFGKSNHLEDRALHVARASTDAGERAEAELAIAGLYRELGVPVAGDRVPDDSATIRRAADRLGWLSFADICAFFGVLLVGFFYVWRRGDLDWVRAVSRQRALALARPPSASGPRQAVLAG